MPKVELIDPATIPGGRVSGMRGSLLLEACTHLQEALRGAKALKIAPEPAERTTAVIQRYRKAGEKLGIEVMIQRVGLRTYQDDAGVEHTEASTFYVVVAKAKPTPPTPGLRPISIPPAQFERTPVPGLEVSR